MESFIEMTATASGEIVAMIEILQSQFFQLAESNEKTQSPYEVLSRVSNKLRPRRPEVSIAALQHC
jgi:anti-sigma-K factor RskA